MPKVNGVKYPHTKAGKAAAANAKKRKQKVPEGYKAGYIGKPGKESKLIFVPDKGRPRKNMKKGGMVKKAKSHRGDGIAKRGRTKGRMV